MALFKGKEGKQQAKNSKMEEKANKIIEEYNLGDIDERDKENLISLSYELAANGLLEVGSFLGGTNEKDELQRLNFFQQAIIEQNFLIIKQLDRLNKTLNSK